MASATPLPFETLRGHCTCKTITFSIQAPPLITHCCHCTSCQRESGSAFAINCVVETYNFTITSPASPVIIGVPSLSSPTGDKHLVAHCAKCFTALYAHYSANKSLMFVKVGALDDDSRTRMRPDVHIFTSTKVEWVDLRREKENGVKVYEEYYRREEVWSEESLRRREVLLEWIEQQEKGAD